ncbi:hypothetical protein BC629DRAFT_756405 [Irpex lacteus]|nr:hypothetical protein BC629DRAFT_756405 [Irpex lacteus]
MPHRLVLCIELSYAGESLALSVSVYVNMNVLASCLSYASLKPTKLSFPYTSTSTAPPSNEGLEKGRGPECCKDVEVRWEAGAKSVTSLFWHIRLQKHKWRVMWNLNCQCSVLIAGPVSNTPVHKCEELCEPTGQIFSLPRTVHSLTHRHFISALLSTEALYLASIPVFRSRPAALEWYVGTQLC